MAKLFLTALLAFASLASDGRAQTSATESDEIVVVGERTEETIRAFVRDISVAAGGQDQLARWDRRICPGVLGLRPRYAQFVIDRMAQRAFDVGLDVGEPGCRANILVVVSLEPDAVAEELFENNRARMGYFHQRGRSTLGRRALGEFVASDEPVRWWHVNATVTRDGEAIGEGTGDPDRLAVVRLTGNSSRLSRGTRQDFGAAFIIVDAGRLEGVDFEALADYLAMVSLAQLDAETDTAAVPTILNLFAPQHGARPAAMTEWDIAYLRGLYSATREASSANRQQGEIAATMNEELSGQ